jgi:hypothetical protein
MMYLFRDYTETFAENAVMLKPTVFVTGQKAWPSSDAKIERQNMYKKDLQ